jgi:hypothetical protein
MPLEPKSYNQVINAFSWFHDHHPVLRNTSWGHGDSDRMRALDNVVYPLMWVAPTTSSIEFVPEGNGAAYVNYTFNVGMSDMVYSSNENQEDITSDTVQLLNDLIDYFKGNPCGQFQIGDNIEIVPFFEAGKDNATGWYAQLNIQVIKPCSVLIESPCSEPNIVYTGVGGGSDPCSHFYCLTSTTIYVTSLSAVTIYSGTTDLTTIINNIITGSTFNTYINNVITGATTGFTTDAQNVGGAAEVFEQKSGSTLLFRTISGGTYMNVTQADEAEVILLDNTYTDPYWISGQSGNFSLMRKMPPNQYGSPYIDHYNTSKYSTISGGKRLTIAGGGYGCSFMGSGYINTIVDTSNYHSHYSSILNGRKNYINVGGGYNNIATYATILGGAENSTAGKFSLIGNGTNNLIKGGVTTNLFQTALNGANHKVYNSYTSVLGGNACTVRGNFATVINGNRNYSYSKYTTVVNGNSNKIGNSNYLTKQKYSSILAGFGHIVTCGHSGVTSYNSQISSGKNNIIVDSSYSTILNGSANQIQSYNYSSILNGKNNATVGTNSTIIHGSYNFNYGNYSSIINSKYSAVALTTPDKIERAIILGLNNFIANSGNTTYVDKLLARSLSASTPGYMMVVANEEGLLSTQAIGSSSGTSTATTTNYKASALTLSNFSGTPYKATVTFSSAFANNNYSISIAGEDERAFTPENKSSAGFRINTNSDIPLTGNTYWTAIAYN